MATTRSKLERSLYQFTETAEQKRNREGKKKYAINYTVLKHKGTEKLKIIGLPYKMEYETVPMHLENMENYAFHTTEWITGDLLSDLTAFAVMEHCQLQITGNRYAPYINQN